MKKFLAFLIIAGILGTIGYFGYNYYIDTKAWKVEVIVDQINVRKDPGGDSEFLTSVPMGSIFNVLDFFDEDPTYVWYKIEYDTDRFGWISSMRGKDNAFVKEINNVNELEDDDFILDYGSPIIRYFDDEYKTYDINSINYDHLEVEDESPFEISHIVYFDEFPDEGGPSKYWIEYIVVDDTGKESSKIQEIIFEIEPSLEDVILIEDR